MIKRLSISNLGPISALDCSSLSNINLIIGPNQSGKTFLLKALFSALKTVEQYKRGRENRTDREILSDKLYWTFQTNTLGGIVRKGERSLSVGIESDAGERFSFSFGPSTTKQANIEVNSFAPRESNSVFIPAKEILSIKDIILESRDSYSAFGFEDPYYDLAKAILKTRKGRNFKAFSQVRSQISDMIGGRLEYDEEKREWQFHDKRNRIYQVQGTSEGVKKISIIELLLGNRYLDNHSVIIIDEIEANLHPMYISRFLQQICTLAEAGVQFFIASHSYFVIKRLYVLAHQQNVDVPVISFTDADVTIGNLHHEMPKNPIIDQAIELYKDEIRLE